MPDKFQPLPADDDSILHNLDALLEIGNLRQHVPAMVGDNSGPMLVFGHRIRLDAPWHRRNRERPLIEIRSDHRVHPNLLLDVRI